MKRELQISVGMIVVLFIMVTSAFGIEGEIENAIGMKFKLINPGMFHMGSSDGPWLERPAHRVTISKGFYMQTTEVTQGQWKALMDKNPSHFKTFGDNFPVENVSWNDARAFIKKLNTKEKTDKYRLPTEAEWEYACRAGSNTDFANDKSIDEMGWYERNSKEKTHTVAEKEANAWGLFDMHGNVWEWVKDCCKDRRSEIITDTYREGLTDPVSTKGRSRICRGGSWYDYDTTCRSANRYSYPPASKDNRLGFRVAKNL